MGKQKYCINNNNRGVKIPLKSNNKSRGIVREYKVKARQTKAKKTTLLFLKTNIMEESNCCGGDRYLGTDLCDQCHEHAEFNECEE